MHDSLIDVATKMGEGNPGALTVICQIINNGARIDPDSALGGLGAVLSLDTHGIYGSRIWMLYKDVCGGNLPLMLAALRAVQLGYVPENVLNHAIDNRGAGLDLGEIKTRVAERLPGFSFNGGDNEDEKEAPQNPPAPGPQAGDDTPGQEEGSEPEGV